MQLIFRENGFSSPLLLPEPFRVQLLLFDSVFHVPPPTEHPVVKLLRVSRKVGDHIAGVGSLLTVFGFGDYLPDIVVGNLIGQAVARSPEQIKHDLWV